jgi:DnaK suppressor protein
MNGQPIVLPRPDYVADNDDQATLMHDEFVSLEVRRIDYSQFKQVEDALTRLDSGNYGLCLGCGSRIAPKRLVALPWAEHCTACEEELSQSSLESPARAA